VYFQIDESEVVYIGQSKNMAGRIRSYMAGGKRFTEFTYIKRTSETLNIYERRLILL